MLPGEVKSASVWDEELFLPRACSLDKVLDLLKRTSFFLRLLEGLKLLSTNHFFKERSENMGPKHLSAPQGASPWLQSREGTKLSPSTLAAGGLRTVSLGPMYRAGSPHTTEPAY